MNKKDSTKSLAWKLAFSKIWPKKLVYFMAMRLLCEVSTTTMSNRCADEIGYMEALRDYCHTHNVYGDKANES